MSCLNFDAIVLGAGPGGVSSAGYLAKAGYKVALVEKTEFPRFKVGESLLPYSMEVFRDLGFQDVLKEHFLQKNGAVFVDFRTGEEIKFDFSNSGKAKFPYAYEVVRSKMDKLFLEHVQEQFGVQTFQPEQVKEITEEPDSILVRLESGTLLQADFLIDASGKSSVLGSKHAKKKDLGAYNDLACFGHFDGLTRKKDTSEGDITIGVLGEGAWTWSIPFKGGTTSVGVVCSKKVFKDLDVGSDIFAHFKEKFPKFNEYMKSTEAVSEMKYASNYSFLREQYYGKRWLLVGDSMGFLDPVFSTGVHIALYSGKLAAEAIVQALKNKEDFSIKVGESYQDQVKLGYKRFSGLLNIFYDPNFIPHMKKTLSLDRTRFAFTELVAGGAWDEENLLFRMGIV